MPSPFCGEGPHDQQIAGAPSWKGPVATSHPFAELRVPHRFVTAVGLVRCPLRSDTTTDCHRPRYGVPLNDFRWNSDSIRFPTDNSIDGYSMGDVLDCLTLISIPLFETRRLYLPFVLRH